MLLREDGNGVLEPVGGGTASSVFGHGGRAVAAGRTKVVRNAVRERERRKVCFLDSRPSPPDRLHYSGIKFFFVSFIYAEILLLYTGMLRP